MSRSPVLRPADPAPRTAVLGRVTAPVVGLAVIALAAIPFLQALPG